MLLPGLLLALVFLASLGAGLFLCLPYWRSSVRRWRDQVLRHLDAAQRQVSLEQRRLRDLEAEFQQRGQALADQVFRGFLDGIGVEQLEAYPGIGSGTIARLRSAGYQSLSSLQNARLRIQGLGQKRLADISFGIRELTKQARATFAAGRCPEAQRLVERQQALAREQEQAVYRARARLQAAEAIAELLLRPADLARRVTLWSYLRHDAQELVPAQLLEAELPTAGDAVRTADEQARKAYAAWRQQQESRRPLRVETDASPNRASVSRQGPTTPPEAIPVAQPVAMSPFQASRLAATPLVAAAAAPVGEAGVQLQTPWRDGAAQAPQATACEVENVHLTHMELTIQLGFAVARCDGHITDKERAAIKEELRRRYEYDSALFNRARAFSAQYEEAEIDVDVCLQRIAALFTVPHRQALLAFAYEIAEASRGINKREAALLDKIAQRLGVEPPAPKEKSASPSAEPKAAPPEEMRARPPSREEHLAALEIDPAAPLSADLIRRQLQLLSERFSPEKVAALGSEFVAMAQAKREAALAAARALIAPFGEPLERPAALAPQGLRDNPDLDAAFGV
jgi:tellurite resistance protein